MSNSRLIMRRAHRAGDPVLLGPREPGDWIKETRYRRLRGQQERLLEAELARLRHLREIVLSVADWEPQPQTIAALARIVGL